EVLVPAEGERDTVHRIIYDELCMGKIMTASRIQYRSVIASLVDRGAQGIILGCTEISTLVGAEDSVVPLFDTTRYHAIAAAMRAITSD
ncbi:MAG: aspartate/glutamate racemase family protein, partial [Dokdonella sp.]